MSTIDRSRLRDFIPDLDLASPADIRSGLRRALAYLDEAAKTPSLRPAADLQAERQARLDKRRNAGHEAALRTAIEKIEEAQRGGQTSATYLTFPDSVVKALREAGYRVTYSKACGMGDMDSHTISWSKP